MFFVHAAGGALVVRHGVLGDERRALHQLGHRPASHACREAAVAARRRNAPATWPVASTSTASSCLTIAAAAAMVPRRASSDIPRSASARNAPANRRRQRRAQGLEGVGERVHGFIQPRGHRHRNRRNSPDQGNKRDPVQTPISRTCLCRRRRRLNRFGGRRITRSVRVRFVSLRSLSDRGLVGDRCAQAFISLRSLSDRGSVSDPGLCRAHQGFVSTAAPSATGDRVGDGCAGAAAESIHTAGAVSAPLVTLDG